MNTKNEIRYDLILGFVTVIISLSAFKEELSSIVINLKFIKFTLSQFFFVFILGTTSAFYLYSLERLFNTLTIKQFQVLAWIQKIAYWIFILFILSPLALAFLWLFAQSNLKLSAILRIIVNSIIGSTIGYFAAYIIKRKYKIRKEKQIEELAKQETVELETAEKLFEQNFNNQSIIVISEVIETHLMKLLQQNNIEISKVNFHSIIKYCLEKNLITNDEFKQIEIIRQLRNNAVHMKMTTTNKEIEFALEFTKMFLINHKN